MNSLRLTSGLLFLTMAANGSTQTLTPDITLAPADGRTGLLFGTSVSISGQTAAIGAAWDANGSNGQQGSVFVYTGNGTSWTQQQRLLASDGTTGDQLGAYTEMLGDTIYAGAPPHGPVSGIKPGAVYLFERVAGVWMQGQKLMPAVAVLNARFGQRIAVNDQHLLISGLASSGQRQVHTYSRAAGTWIEQGAMTPQQGGPFGSHIALHGNTAVVGAAGATGASSGTGVAYIFDYDGSGFAQTARIFAGDGANGDNFGFTVALWDQVAVVGASNDDSVNLNNHGSAYVFERTPGGWVERVKLMAPDAAADDQFGKDVRICGDRIYVGAPQADIGGNSNQGAMYRFDRSGNTWTYHSKYTLATPGRSNSYFGDHLGVDATGLVTGAPFMDRSFVTSGGCFVDQIHKNSFE